MNKSITVSVKNVFGKELVYPECAASELFSRIAGTKTLGEDAISYIRQLGYTIETKQLLSA